ncbi:MAG: cyclic nucleotide-binding domain-containing protein [Hyphomicrobiales bacterium]|nr:cyclic nucleotide-binding domain-containing protein [Hyphomicrobiales bacterium]
MSLERDIGLMRRLPILEELSEEQLRLIAFSAENRRIGDGTVLFRSGERGDAAYVVAEGEIVLTQEGEDGNEQVERCGPGAMIGARALLLEAPRPANATAVGETEIIQIRRAVFRRMMTEYPDIAARLHARLASGLATANAELAQIADRLDATADDL